jgi:hypothetical protein
MVNQKKKKRKAQKKDQGETKPARARFGPGPARLPPERVFPPPPSSTIGGPHLSDHPPFLGRKTWASTATTAALRCASPAETLAPPPHNPSPINPPSPSSISSFLSLARRQIAAGFLNGDPQTYRCSCSNLARYRYPATPSGS